MAMNDSDKADVEVRYYDDTRRMEDWREFCSHAVIEVFRARLWRLGGMTNMESFC